MNRFIKVGVLSLLGIVISPSLTAAKIVINEISPASDPEWVELHSDNSDSLKGCILYLHNTEDTKQKITFAEDIKIEATFFVVKKGEYGWSSNWLNNSGDSVKIKCESSEDGYTYTDIKDKTVGRSPDGTGEFFVLSAASEGGANTAPTPAPTEKPSSPVPTPRPTPSPTIISTIQPTTFSSPTATTVAKKTSVPQVMKTSITPMPSPLVIGTATDSEVDKSPLMFYGFMAVGALFIGVGSYPFVKKLYNEKHASNEKIS